MRSAVQALFGAVIDQLNPQRLQHRFELLGLDFMVDAKGQVSSSSSSSSRIAGFQ